MENKLFQDVATSQTHPQWEELITRNDSLYERKDDARSPFSRDYTRILHSHAYRRLKHKTQVFYNVDNDHICTRMEHVAHVESVSSTIAQALGLNTELTKAIAIGHDLGHAPFGHHGEVVIQELIHEHIDPNERFWHERNGLKFVDEVELLEDSHRIYRNLSLTYAVRDGIISHCGEVNENGLRPREDRFDLNEFQIPGQYQPATWEGCVVKISDKIAYLGRDVEDAIRLGFLDDKAQDELLKMARMNDHEVMNTTTIIYTLISDICRNSDPDKGICLSEPYLKMFDSVKDYNYRYIYKNKRFRPFENYSRLVIRELFDFLMDFYREETPGSIWENFEEAEKYYPTLLESFESHLSKYCDDGVIPRRKEKLRAIALKCDNKKIYGRLDSRKEYARAIINFISGMTDRFAIEAFEELIHF